MSSVHVRKIKSFYENPFPNKSWGEAYWTCADLRPVDLSDDLKRISDEFKQQLWNEMFFGRAA